MTGGRFDWFRLTLRLHRFELFAFGVAIIGLVVGSFVDPLEQPTQTELKGVTQSFSVKAMRAEVNSGPMSASPASMRARLRASSPKGRMPCGAPASSTASRSGARRPLRQGSRSRGRRSSRCG